MRNVTSNAHTILILILQILFRPNSRSKQKPLVMFQQIHDFSLVYLLRSSWLILSGKTKQDKNRDKNYCFIMVRKYYAGIL